MKTLLSAAALAMMAATLSSPSARAEDWTGGYVGGQVGYANVDPSNGSGDGSGATYGVNAGYDYDFGDWVLGGELDYDRLNVDFGTNGALNADYVTRAKLRLGYDFGDVLGYFVTGPARLKSTLGSKTDAFFGVGMSVLASPQWSLSGEYLYQDFKSVGGSGIDAKLNTFTLRAAFRF